MTLQTRTRPWVISTVAALAGLSIGYAFFPSGPSDAQVGNPLIEEVIAPPPPPVPLPPERTIPMPDTIVQHPIITRNLSLARYHADTTIRGGVATTKVSLDFRNDTGGILEGEFVFPVPKGAVITDFALRDGDKRLTPELLEATQARNWYEEIVRQAIDPGLLEYIDQSAYKVHAFPFQPGQTRTIEISFSHTCPNRGPVRVYTLPLQFAMSNVQLIRNLQWENSRIAPQGITYDPYWQPPTAQFVATVAVNEPGGLGAISSPTHTVAVRREGNNDARVSLESSMGTAARDFQLLIGRTNQEFSATILTYPGKDGEDGYFSATIYPAAPQNMRPIPKDVVLVLDTSGSMEGEKWTQAQGAITYVVNHLNAEDRFALIDYDDLVNSAWEGLRTANAANRQEASTYISRLGADGGTNINDALLRASDLFRADTDATRPNYLLFFTDGLPTVGTTDVGTIVGNVQDRLPQGSKLFAFGVGYDVNTVLLDQLSRNHKGISDYVQPNQNIESVVTAFYQKMQFPALTDITIDWGGLAVYDVFPTQLPDLFHGTQVHLAGRYRGTPPSTVNLRVSGSAGGQNRTVTLPSEAAPLRSHDFVPRLWANMRVGSLLETVKLNGDSPELIEEIRRLAMRYGIVTPYTSYLVREEMRFDQMAQERELSAPSNFAMDSGAGAVMRSESTNMRKGWTTSGQSASDMDEAYAEQGMAPPAPMPQEFDDNRDRQQANGRPQGIIQNVGNLTFLQAGIGMVDSRYEPAKPTRVVQIAAFGDRYFTLLEQYPALGEYLSLSSEVTIQLGPNLVLQTVVLDEGTTPVAESQVNALSNQPNSQSPASYTEATASDWTEVQNALSTGYFQG